MRPQQAYLIYGLVAALPLGCRPDGRVDILPVGMQACGDVMIGHHGRSVHEAIPHICGAKAIPTSLLLLSSPRNKIVNQSNQRLSDYLTSSMTLLLVVTLTC